MYGYYVVIMIDCTTNGDCTGTTDTCKSSRCYCGSEDECTGRSDTCTGGRCQCGENDKCSSVDICSFGQCKRK